MSLCLSVAGQGLSLAVGAFTLAWSHSVEKTRWEEDWRVGPAGLEIVRARVKGSGAGMDPGEGAVLRDGWWVWRPALGPVPELRLAASGATGGGWTLCAGTPVRCLELGASADRPVRLWPCEGGSG